jgi:hypothetical protein
MNVVSVLASQVDTRDLYVHLQVLYFMCYLSLRGYLVYFYLHYPYFHVQYLSCSRYNTYCMKSQDEQSSAPHPCHSGPLALRSPAMAYQTDVL